MLNEKLCYPRIAPPYNLSLPPFTHLSPLSSFLSYPKRPRHHTGRSAQKTWRKIPLFFLKSYKIVALALILCNVALCYISEWFCYVFIALFKILSCPQEFICKYLWYFRNVFLLSYIIFAGIVIFGYLTARVLGKHEGKRECLQYYLTIRTLSFKPSRQVFIFVGRGNIFFQEPSFILFTQLSSFLNMHARSSDSSERSRHRILVRMLKILLHSHFISYLLKKFNQLGSLIKYVTIKQSIVTTNY